MWYGVSLMKLTVVDETTYITTLSRNTVRMPYRAAR